MLRTSLRFLSLLVVGSQLTACTDSFQSVQGQVTQASRILPRSGGRSVEAPTTENLYAPYLTSPPNHILITPTSQPNPGTFFLTQFTPAASAINREVVTAWNLGDFTGLYTWGYGSQMGVANGWYGSTSVQMENGEVGIQLHTDSLRLPDGSQYPINNISAGPWLNENTIARPFTTPDSVLMFIVDLQIPTAYFAGSVGYVGMNYAFRDTRSGKSFFSGAMLYDSRGEAAGVDMAMYDDWIGGTHMPIIGSRPGPGSRYIAETPFSAPRQSDPWRGYKRFEIVIDRISMVRQLERLRQFNGFGDVSLDPGDYVIDLVSMAPEINSPNGSFGMIGLSFKNFLVQRRTPSVEWFSESDYLTMYGDVRAAVESGGFPNGRAHYDAAGAREGRSPNFKFNERAYLDANGDVAAAVARGDIRCGFDHYLANGRAEGRPAYGYY